MGLISKFTAAFNRLHKRFDFADFKKSEARQERAKKGRRPPKRKRRK